mmetsp:Transcript_60131/g.127385  ORF Transcript_60131/g.127385 Transcript_60131/m.127385 type:complete len:368 (+) Transcript_60131:332-1435(+)
MNLFSPDGQRLENATLFPSNKNFLFFSVFCSFASVATGTVLTRNDHNLSHFPEMKEWISGQKPLMRSDRHLLEVSAAEATQAVPQLIYLTGPAQMLEGAHLALWERNRQYLPAGAELRYYNDQQMAEDVRALSPMLAAEGIIGAFAAFANLRPGAYRADLWRYIRLWDSGGIYIDLNSELKKPVTDWMDLSRTELQVVKDWSPGMLFNGVFAGPPRDAQLAQVIKLVVNQIHEHSYCNTSVGMSCKDGGWDCGDPNPGYLAITGPRAFAAGLGMTLSTGKAGNWAFQEMASGQQAVPIVVANVSITETHLPGNPVLLGDLRLMDRRGQEVLWRNLQLHADTNGGSYARYWKGHQVYCDEPGPPCQKF